MQWWSTCSEFLCCLWTNCPPSSSSVCPVTLLLLSQCPLLISNFSVPWHSYTEKCTFLQCLRYFLPFFKVQLFLNHFLHCSPASTFSFAPNLKFFQSGICGFFHAPTLPTEWQSELAQALRSDGAGVCPKGSVVQRKRVTCFAVGNCKVMGHAQLWPMVSFWGLFKHKGAEFYPRQSAPPSKGCVSLKQPACGKVHRTRPGVLGSWSHWEQWLQTWLLHWPAGWGGIGVKKPRKVLSIYLLPSN